MSRRFAPPRRFDPLESLTPAMRFALRAGEDAGFEFCGGGVYRDRLGRAHAPITLRSLAERGLVRLSAGPDGQRRRFALTREGQRLALELQRRADVRAALIAERQEARR